MPIGLRAIRKLLDLHDDLLAGRTGRKVNGFGALLLVVLSFTGIVVWWPGIKTWRRSLTVHRNVGWRRFTWELHSMIGFWSLGVIVMFGISGAYLGNPDPFQDFADWLEPAHASQCRRALRRQGDLLARLPAFRPHRRDRDTLQHQVGAVRLDDEVGVGSSRTRIPAAMFVTGAVMWWNRVVRRKLV